MFTRVHSYCKLACGITTLKNKSLLEPKDYLSIQFVVRFLYPEIKARVSLATQAQAQAQESIQTPKKNKQKTQAQG